MVRIAILSEHASPAARLGGVDAGGQNVYVDEISRLLGEEGMEVDVFTRRDSPDLPLVQPWSTNVRIVNLAVGPPEWVFKDELWPLMPEFERAVLAFAAEHSAGYPPYDLIHGNFWMSGWVATLLGRRWRIPVVEIFHALGLTKRRQQGEQDTSPGERIRVERVVARDANRLIAQCPEERRELLEDYGAAAESVTVIPSGVDTDVFRPVDRAAARAALGIGEDESVVVYVGRLLPRKDIRNVVRALGILKRRGSKPVRLLVVGGETAIPDPDATPEIGELQRLAAEVGVTEWITFVGRRQPCELAGYYCTGDVAVTTPWYEPFGLTPLEAMACGVPVIGSDVGGISYTVQDGVTGLLVPPRDPAALAARLHGLLARPARCREMGKAARQRVVAEFTWPVAATRTAALYEELLARPGSAPAPPVSQVLQRSS